MYERRVREYERLVEELRSIGRRKDEFIAVLAHELRNPLAPISNALEILELRAEDPAAVRTARALIERQVAQLTRLVEDLLDVARVAHGQLALRKRTIDLAAVARTAIETARPLIQARKHHLTATLEPGIALVQGDACRLTQVLANLLINAAKYTEDGGRIALSVVKDGGWVIAKVRDNGIGIASDLLPHIFDAYVQAGRRPRGSGGGLGLGLMLARQLVELHGGALEAHSEGPGLGSEFVMRLPAAVLTNGAKNGKGHAIWQSSRDKDQIKRAVDIH